MIEFRGHWEGLETLGPVAFEELKPRAILAVTNAAATFARELKLTLTGKRHGRSYKVSKTGELHIASAPGEPPAVLFDNLRGSVGFTPATFDGAATVSAEVGIGLGVNSKKNLTANSYALRLEFGGMDSRGRFLEKRPYVLPTEIRTEPAITRILEAL